MFDLTYEKRPIASIGKRFAFNLLLIAVIVSQVSLASADSETYRKVVSATTWVLTKNADGTSGGTGVLVDQKQRLVITNAHVVGDSRSAVLFFQESSNGNAIVEKSHYLENIKKLGVRGRVVSVDRKRDLALVQLDRLPDGAIAVELAPQSTGPGTVVHSVGNPGSSDALWVYTSGTVRSVYRKKFRTTGGDHDFRVVETQSPINTGDSGGPVVDSQGKLIGIAQAFSHKASLVSYCVDIAEVKDFLDSPWKSAPLPTEEVLGLASQTFERHKSGHYYVEVALDAEKKYSVFVAKEIEYYERAEVRKVWALAATLKQPPAAETCLKLLAQNGQTKIGSWTIENESADVYRVLYVIKLDATASPETLRSTLAYAAKIASDMEKEMAPKPTPQTPSEVLANWLAE